MKGRSVCCLPRHARFGPLGRGTGNFEEIKMTVDEYETIRLIDHEGFTQEECAQQMNVARTTVQGIYDRARRKLALLLVEGLPLSIEGGAYTLYGESGGGCGRGACGRHRRGRGRTQGPDQAENG